MSPFMKSLIKDVITTTAQVIALRMTAPPESESYALSVVPVKIGGQKQIAEPEARKVGFAR